MTENVTPPDHRSEATAAYVLENPAAAGPFVVICEHASNAFPAPWGDLGLDAAAQRAHIAWDPGALGLARGLAQALQAPLIAGAVSRLIYDLNRPPHSPSAMAAKSEIYTVPGNAALTAEARATRTEALYVPFHARLRALIAARLARGERPVLVTVHSFTPVYNGQHRAVEFGVIHDADPRLAQAVQTEAEARSGLLTQLNAPYSAADEVTHTLALQATPMDLPNVMLEIRNDLIDSPEAEAAMAARLAPILRAALHDLTAQEAR